MSSFLDYLNGNEEPEREDKGDSTIMERMLAELVSIRELLEEIADGQIEMAEQREAEAKSKAKSAKSGDSSGVQTLSTMNVGMPSFGNTKESDNLREGMVDPANPSSPSQELLEHIEEIGIL